MTTTWTTKTSANQVTNQWTEQQQKQLSMAGVKSLCPAETFIAYMRVTIYGYPNKEDTWPSPIPKKILKFHGPKVSQHGHLQI